MCKSFDSFPSPCFVIEEDLLLKNLEKIHSVEERTGCHILLAQKCFSAYHVYGLMRPYLSGVTSSSLFEARLGAEEMGTETHIFAPAYLDSEFEEICRLCDHIVFNSLTQWNHHKSTALANKVSCGLRINPQYSEIETDLYNPCIPGSRFGISWDQLANADLSGIEGIHFHTMCEQNADTLERTLQVVEDKFGWLLHQMKWVNFGGGHHIAREDYDVECLVRCIRHIKETYDVEVYLEPGEGIALNSGFLVSTVLDIVHNGMDIAILDASAACHMPDVLEMPYRPPVLDSDEPGVLPHTYRLGGNTCLAGDVIGDYSFAQPLTVGSRIIFGDMAIYSMVKTNMFNGINLPSVAVRHCDGSVCLVKEFHYEDFKSRL